MVSSFEATKRLAPVGSWVEWKGLILSLLLHVVPYGDSAESVHDCLRIEHMHTLSPLFTKSTSQHL